MTDTLLDAALSVCRLLGDAANGRALSTEALPDETVLLAFCKAHRIETLVSSALRIGGVEDTAFHALHDAAAVAAFRQTKNDAVAAVVPAQLEREQVHAQLLKGTALQAVYPEGWIRTSTDIDLYVTPEQADKACAALTAMGFVRTRSADGDICFQKPPQTAVEIHTTLGGYSEKQRRALHRLCRTPFTVNEHYVYTLFHLYKHFVYAGAGVRLFFDIDRLSRAVTDRQAVERWLEELGLSTFEHAVHTVNGILFDGEPCSDAMAEVVVLIIRSGAFGTGETYYAMKDAARPITHKNRVRVWLEDYGFDRQAMTARYTVLRRHLWLYPFCAAHRVIRGAIFKQTVLKTNHRTAHALDRRQMTRVLKTMQIL